MQKFGIFDLVEKLAPAEKLLKNVLTPTKTENLTDKKGEKPLEKPPTSSQKKPSKSSVDSLLCMLKKHDEISKRIDKNNKK